MRSRKDDVVRRYRKGVSLISYISQFRVNLPVRERGEEGRMDLPV